jgi:hypothetical protein
MNAVSNQVEIVRFKPRLTVVVEGTDVVLNWSDPRPWVVQATTNLNRPVLWSDVAKATNQFRISGLDPSPRFFRLTGSF